MGLEHILYLYMYHMKKKRKEKGLSANEVLGLMCDCHILSMQVIALMICHVFVGHCFTEIMAFRDLLYYCKSVQCFCSIHNLICSNGI